MKIRSRKLGPQGFHNNSRNCWHQQAWGHSRGQSPSVWLIQHLDPLQLIDGSEQWLLGIVDFTSSSRELLATVLPSGKGFQDSVLCAPPPHQLLCIFLLLPQREGRAGCYVVDRIWHQQWQRHPAPPPPACESASRRGFLASLGLWCGQKVVYLPTFEWWFFPPRISEYRQASVPT